VDPLVADLDFVTVRGGVPVSHSLAIAVVAAGDSAWSLETGVPVMGRSGIWDQQNNQCRNVNRVQLHGYAPHPPLAVSVLVACCFPYFFAGWIAAAFGLLAEREQSHQFAIGLEGTHSHFPV
jgi:hypothetical protein